MGLMGKNVIQSDWWTDNDAHFQVDRFAKDYNQMTDGHTEKDGPGFTKSNYFVNISNREEAISYLEQLNQTVGLGKDILEKLHRSVESLRVAWRGSDAKANLTQLLIIKGYVGQFTSIFYEVGKSIHKQLQNFSDRTVENKGKSYDIPNFQTIDFGDLFILNPDIADTLEVFVDPSLARPEIQNISMIKAEFEDFSNRIFQLSSYILEVWKSGGTRENFDARIQDYQKKYQEFISAFEGCIRNLDQAITNWES